MAINQAQGAEGDMLKRNAASPMPISPYDPTCGRAGLRPGLPHVRVALVPRVHLLYCPSTQVRECLKNQRLRSSFFPHHGFETLQMCLRGSCRARPGRRTMRGRSDTDVSFVSRVTVGTWCGHLICEGAGVAILRNERRSVDIWGGLSLGSSCLS